MSLVGVPGDSATLLLAADSSIIASLPLGETVTATVGGAATSLPIASLAGSPMVLRLTSSDTTTIIYTINRQLTNVPTGNFALIEQTSAQVVADSTPWVAGGAPASIAAAVVAPLDPCSAGEAVNISGTYCGVTVQFSPWAPADAFLNAGARFQSNPGHGQSHTITITLSGPASAVTVTVYDPTIPTGNQMEAFDANGASLGVAQFPGNGRAGVLTTQTRTISGAIRRIVLTAPIGDYVAYSMMLAFVPATTLSIASAAGPNAGGSFTVAAGESQVTLQANVSPSSLAAQVKWLVDDDPSDAVQTVPPSSVADGTPSAFTVPSPQMQSRYTAYKHPGRLNQKSLSLRVQARVTDDNGQTITSTNTDTVRQDEIDTMREEYIERPPGQGVVPGRGEFVDPDASHPDSADYTKVLKNSSFDGKVAQLATVWTETDLIASITGAYRNPVHNWRHISERSGSGPIGSSWHMYACALDFQTYPILHASSSTHADTLTARAYWDRLSAKASSVGFRVEPRDFDPNKPQHPYSGIGHVHVEVRCR